jgi:hypothetical protein
MKPRASSIWRLLDRVWVLLFPPEVSSLPLLILNWIIFSWRCWRSWVRTPFHPTAPFPPLVAQAQLQLQGGASVFTPVAAEVGASAFNPVAVGGNNPTGPGLPTFFANANTTPSVVNTFPSVQNFPANRGTCARDPTAAHQQSYIAAGKLLTCGQKSWNTYQES